MANWLKRILGNDDSSTDDDIFRDLDSNLNLDTTNKEEFNFGIDLKDSSDNYEMEEAVEEEENEGYSEDYLDLENEDDEEDGEEDFDSDSDLEDNDNETFSADIIKEWQQQQIDQINELDAKREELQRKIDEIKMLRGK